MREGTGASGGRSLAVLHPAFALTGVLHAISGPLMPSLAAGFHLNDSQTGFLFLLYFAGTSVGALVCKGDFARNLWLSFVGAGCCLLGLAWANQVMLQPLFLLLGISVGDAMSAVSLFAGRNFPERCASILTTLNFTWSIGAFVAPLLAGQVLAHASYRAAYMILAVASAFGALLCAVLLRDRPEQSCPPFAIQSGANLGLILVFAVAAFLQVGVENTAAAWLSTYSLRKTGEGLALAAAASSFYWVGFLGSRGLSSLLLMRIQAKHVYQFAVWMGLVAGVALAYVSTSRGRDAAMLLLGAALAPIYPLLIAGSFARTRRIADSRWVLATAGFGGSVLPWFAGWISSQTGTMRSGILLIPAAIMLMIIVVPGMTQERGNPDQQLPV